MDLFTDRLETSFFKTDDHLKNLKPITINSIEDFVTKYSFDPMVLLGVKSLMVSRFDGIITINVIIDHSFDEPDIFGEYLEVDFIQDADHLDILFALVHYLSIDDYFLEHLKDSDFPCKFDENFPDNNEHVWTISTIDCPERVLEIIIAEDGTAKAKFLS